jgi:hypothetical protein
MRKSSTEEKIIRSKEGHSREKLACQTSETMELKAEYNTKEKFLRKL